MKKLSSKIIRDIIDKYNNGESVVDIAIEYNISKTTVYEYIKNNPNAIKKTSYTNLSDTTIDNIIKDYKSGIKVIDLAKKYNVSKVTIYSHIKELSKRKNKFSKDIIDKIIEEYNSGNITMSNLSKKYNISIRSIYNYLNNKPKNHPEKISHKLNDDTIDSLRLDYVNGIDINYICGKYSISLTTAYKYTKDLRPIINKKLSNDDIENIRKEYLDEGKTANELANKYGISICTVYNYTRGLLDRSTYKISDNIIKSIIEDYKNNIRIKDICDKYSISRSTAYKYIKLIEGDNKDD